VTSDPRIVAGVKKGRGVFGRTAACVLILAAIVGVWHLPPFVEALRRLEQGFAHGGLRGALAYAALFASCNVLLLPGGFLTIGAGALFGVWRGFAIVLAANTVGAAIAFVAGRTFRKQILQRFILRNRRMQAIRPAIEREGWKIIFLSQLHPLFPTSLLVYLYALTEIGFWPCMSMVALGRAPGLFLYAYLGATGRKGLGALDAWSISWLVAIIITIVLLIALGRISRKILAGYSAAADLGDNPSPARKAISINHG
jgi:uncharacterized membrane protein YdjX (TVP38/TMEM64 family)